MWLASPDPLECRDWSRAAEGSYLLSHIVSSTGALVPVEGGDAVLHAFLPAAAQPALVQHWDITRPWHPRSGMRERRQRQEQQPEEQQPEKQLQEEQQPGEQQLGQQLPEPPPPLPPKLGFFGL